ncbi:MAG: twin-arginine translocase TatA/TatE family subunit [Bacteroidaceae bacterium]|nr:twin-arginine translocase TatA/TatE family subunit [Bacteroidaceae bacterium]
MIQLVFIGTTELLLLGGMALLLFGGKKLPEMMRGLGQGVSEFKKGMKDIQEETVLTENESGNHEESKVEKIEEISKTETVS